MSTSFENSAMKSSFSLSSLRSAPTQNGARYEPLERPYHSLTKKRKEPCREAWRRSWGSAASGGSAGDDLWPLLQHHYDYIMDNQIIDSCKEANGELLSHNPAGLQPPCLLNPTTGFNRQWSLSQLVSEFSELCQWLTHVQDEIYSSPENLSSRKLRMSRISELVSIEPRRVKFIEQASAILERIPEASAEVSWRVGHLNAKWESLRLLLSPDRQTKDGSVDTVDTGHELRCLRRWLHAMEGRLPPPSLAAARSCPPQELLRKLQEHEVLQRDVECHSRIVSSVVRLCGGGDAARALERRWHLLYLRAIEWQCHLEACLSRIDNQGGFPNGALSDSDEGPALKQRRLCRGSPRRLRTNPTHARPRSSSADSRQSCSEEEQEEYVIVVADEVDMGERIVPGEPTPPLYHAQDQTVPGADTMDGCTMSPTAQNVAETLNDKTPPTVIKRKKSVNTSRFNQSDRKSKHLATFYFKHHDTDSDRQLVETDDKSQEESSEEEWTYVEGPKIANEDSGDIMTSSVELQLKNDTPNGTIIKMESITPDLLKDRMDIGRLVDQVEELVQKPAQKKKAPRNLKPLPLDEESKGGSRAKMSRIKEWLNQNTEEQNGGIQCTESYDASGEYTTESEVDTSFTSEDRNIHSSMDMSTSTCTVTPTHQAKVQLRKKRAAYSARPWSVSCLSQLSGAGEGGAGAAATSLACTPTARDVAASAALSVSISESALHTLATPHVTPSNSNAKLCGSSTTVQGHISSTNTMTEAYTSCVEGEGRWRARRKRLRRCHRGGGGQALPSKALSFCGRFSPDKECALERSAASDPPATTTKNRCDTTSTSGNDSDEDQLKEQHADIAHLRRSIEKTHITNREESSIPEQNETEPMPSFKLGPAGGLVRPRLAKSSERERAILTLSLGDPNMLYDLTVDKDSDIDRSINTAGTEEHSSFSEQAWDFYQEKYNSEPYSEAPDSDAARRLLDFGDDYRTYLDSQSDCCSNLSSSAYRQAARKQPTRKPKRLMATDRKKSLQEILERSMTHTDSVRRKMEALRRRHNYVTSDEVNSSLEYERPDLLEHSKWSESESDDETRSLLRRSSSCLEKAEAHLADSRCDYTDIVKRCHENIGLLEAILAAKGSVSPARQKEIRAVSARWSALRAAATRRSGARRLRREIAALRETLDDISEPGESAPQPHTKAQLQRRIHELKERLARLFENKVSILKLNVSVRRTLSEIDSDDGLGAELAALLDAWDEAQQRTSNEMLSLEKALSTWTEWESALRELQGALRGDLATLQALRDRDDADQTEIATQIKQLAASLADKKGSSSCDSLSDSGISDGDSEGAGGRARRLAALRELARRLQDSLHSNSPAYRTVAKRMEQTEREVRTLQESCRALVEQNIPELKLDTESKEQGIVTKTGSGDPDYNPRGWIWRVLRSSLPIQLCLVCLLLAAWLVERPRCCDNLNSLSQTLTPQLRYVRGPPPM